MARRVLTIVCIAVVIVTAATPAASELPAIVLVPLDPLFSLVVSVPIPETESVRLVPVPVLSVRSPRAPPRA